MRIAVCLKQVPDTQDMALDDHGFMVRKGTPLIINPYDEFGLEEGIRLKERLEGATVTVLTMGPSDAEQSIREAIARGADEGVLLTDEQFSRSDVPATARVMAAAVRKLEDIKLVICGKQSSDGATGLFAAALGEVLDWPVVTLVRKIREIGPSGLVTERLVEGGVEVVVTTLPAVISVVKEINEPRLASLKGVMRAKRATVQRWGAAELQVNPDQVGEKGSRTRVMKTWQPQRDHVVTLFEGSSREQAKRLAATLNELRLI